MRSKGHSSVVFRRVAGEALWKTLGYANERAFRRARQAHRVPVPLYPLGGKSGGVFARSDELAAYLASVADEESTKGGGDPDMT